MPILSSNGQNEQHQSSPSNGGTAGLPWSPSLSSSLYKLDTWGSPYFSVNPQGHVCVAPDGLLLPTKKPCDEIDLMKVVHQALKPLNKGGLGLSTPLIIRFPHILKHRLQCLQSAFDNAIRNHHNYNNTFRAVFPVKCNQDRAIVENIVSYGKPFGFGLEAGSKPELLLAMASLCYKGSPDALLICNGYKDAHYVCLALMARLRLRLHSVIVLEQEEELDIVLKVSAHLSIEPVIGLRAKLNTKHDGHFGDTSGEKGKFGLSCSEIMSVVNKLKAVNKLHCLQLLHFHIGSQIPSTAILKDGVSEAAHIYCELARMGANMKIMDIGGGLGIDYDGTKSSSSDMSVGYTLDEYAAQVVGSVKNACDMKGIEPPMLCSESGRALVSHHSVLVFDVISSSTKAKHTSQGLIPSHVQDEVPSELRNLVDVSLEHIRDLNYDGALEVAKLLKEECIHLFKGGQFGLPQLASIHNFCDVVSEWVSRKDEGQMSSIFAGNSTKVRENETTDLHHNAIYHINLSIFQSMPDTWAIGQLFPIMPLQRLNEEPKVRAILSDLTCDSDGKITKFIGTGAKGGKLNYLNVHSLEEGKPYYMGMFLGGAYQEALGGIHNLFGSLDVVNVNKDGRIGNGFKVTKGCDGQTIGDVLRRMDYDPSTMLECVKLHIQKNLECTNDGGDNNMMDFIEKLAWSFEASPYLSSNNVISPLTTERVYTRFSRNNYHYFQPSMPIGLLTTNNQSMLSSVMRATKHNSFHMVDPDPFHNI